MAAPVVQSLADVMAGLDPAYNQSQALIDKQRGGLGAKYGAQKTGLEAQKVQGFNTINNQATGRGLSFSGIPIDEQATYLSTKYLPAIAAVDQQQNEEDMALQKDAATLNREKTNQALGIVEGQKKELSQWQMQQEQFEQQRRMQAESQAFQASQASASRAASAPTGPSRQKIIDSLNNWTKGKTGKVDKKLSPSDFKAGYQLAAGYGMSVADYAAVMQKYINNSHSKDYRF